MGLRNAADVQSEYIAVRDAYLAALKAESYSVSTGAGNRTLTRARVDTLKKQMQELSAEYDRLTSGNSGGIRIWGATPT